MVGNKRGFTLIELTVAAALLGFLMTMLYQLLVPTMKEVKRSEADVDTQTALAIALDRFRSEAAYSSPLSTTVLENPGAVCFLSVEDPDHGGVPTLGPSDFQLLDINTRPLDWGKFVVWYHDEGNSTLNRKEFPYPAMNRFSLARIPAEKVRDLLLTNTYPVQPVARGIEQVDFDMDRPPLLVVDLTAVREGIHDRKETHLTFTTTMRN